VVAVIPARYDSQRFPGKPLIPICGKPMVQWVYERACQASTIDEVIVATDDQRILEAVEAFGGKAVMTAAEHPSGTDRIAEAVDGIEADLVVNVQGDEPLLPPEIIDQLVLSMRESQAEMGTVAVPFDSGSADFGNPNNVKVVLDSQGFALYFSRAGIPFQRDAGSGRVAPLLHWGLYAYRREFLRQFISWPPGQLETCEKLEQLRALENGTRIRVIQAAESCPDVNVPEDVPRVEQELKRRGEAS
jgi:3-deoxy-manno-octulosonate cytidylyltransferase (CMP-KDO synthetase)